MINDLIHLLASYIRPHIIQTAVLTLTISLVVLDTYFHATMKGMVRQYNFILRVIAYIVLFTVVYGFIVTYFSPILARWYYSLTDGVLLLVLAFVFVLLGVMMDRK